MCILYLVSADRYQKSNESTIAKTHFTPCKDLFLCKLILFLELLQSFSFIRKHTYIKRLMTFHYYIYTIKCIHNIVFLFVVAFFIFISHQDYHHQDIPIARFSFTLTQYQSLYNILIGKSFRHQMVSVES